MDFQIRLEEITLLYYRVTSGPSLKTAAEIFFLEA